MEERRQSPRFEVEIPIKLIVKASREAPAYAVFNGCAVVLSQTGMLCAIDNFEEKFFNDITTTNRFVVSRAFDPPVSFPGELIGRIVGVKFKKTDLPLAQISIAFQDIKPALNEQLAEYIEVISGE